jgi:hypothetical protein
MEFNIIPRHRPNQTRYVCEQVLALPNLRVDIGYVILLDRRLVPFSVPSSHRTPTGHVRNERYFSVRRGRGTVMLPALRLQEFDSTSGELGVVHEDKLHPALVIAPDGDRPGLAECCRTLAVHGPCARMEIRQGAVAGMGLLRKIISPTDSRFPSDQHRPVPLEWF